MFSSFDLAFAGLNHRGWRVEGAIDELGDITFTYKPRQITLQTSELIALLDRKCLLDGRGSAFAFCHRSSGRRGGDVEEFATELAGFHHRVHLDKRDKRANAVRERLARDAEFPLHGAHIADALRAFLENCEMLAAQTTAKRIGSIERETTLTLKRAFDGAANLAWGQELEIFTVQAGLFYRADDFVTRVGQQVGFGFFKGIKCHRCRSRSGFGHRSALWRRRWSRFSSGSLRCRNLTGSRRSRLGDNGFSRFSSLGRFCGGLFPRVARGLLHFFKPSLDRFRLAHRFDPSLESLKRHTVDFRRVVLLHELVVEVIVRRPEQFARHPAAVNNLEVTLRRIDYDVGRVEECAKVLGQHVGQSGFFVFKGQPVRHGNHKTRRSRSIRCRFASEYDDETIGLCHHGARHFEKFDSAARFTDGLHERTKARIFRVERCRKIRAIVRTAINRFTTAAETTATFTATGAIAAWAAGTFTARAATKFTLTFTGIGRTFAGKFTPLRCTTTGAAGSARTRATSRTIKRTTVAALGRTTSAVTTRTIIAAFAATPLVRRRFILHP